jgi:hypothetical protein
MLGLMFLIYNSLQLPLLHFMVFFTRFLIKKTQNDKHKKKPPCQFGLLMQLGNQFVPYHFDW